VGRVFSEAYCSYLAGFFDADGAIMACIEKHHEKKFGFRVRLIIKIAQKNRCFLETIQAELKCGYVRLNRNVYEYDIKNQEDVLSFIDLVFPYVRLKKVQLQLAREIACKLKGMTTFQHLLEIAQLADTLSSFNVRSKNRRKNYVAKIQENIPRND
jgi:hypothetical protein